jgi:hypothetical protein
MYAVNVTLIVQLPWFLLEAMTIHSILQPKKVPTMWVVLTLNKQSFTSIFYDEYVAF